MRISIDGNIGASKSTVISYLSRKLRGQVTCYPEPVDAWGDMLRLYYENPSTYALPFSLRVLLGFNASNDSPTPHQIVERSPLACRHVFTQMLADDGTLSQAQFDVFKDYYDAMSWEPDVIIFIETPAGTCLDRITARGRECEAGIDFQHLRRLEYMYDNLMREQQARVVRVDGTGSPVDVALRVMDAVQKILSA